MAKIKQTWLAVALCALGWQTAAQADVYDDMRLRWQNRTGSVAALPPDDPDLLMQQAAQADAPDHYVTLKSSAGMGLPAGQLWSDLPLDKVSANLTSTVERLQSIADAYADPRSPYYHQAEVMQRLQAGLDAFIAARYTATATAFDNWWDWQIGTPQGLNKLMLSTYAALTPARIAAVCAAIDRYVPDPTRRTAANGSVTTLPETGANLLDKAFVVVMRGIVGKNGDKIRAGRDAIPAALPEVSSGDGFYADGSFIQHTYVPYIGGYGSVLINDIARLYYVLAGSSWPIDGTPLYNNPYHWAINSYAPFIYNGALMDNQRGRSISRWAATDHVAGRSTIMALAELTQSLSAADARELKSLIKGWVQRDSSFGSSYFTPVAGNGNKLQTVSTLDLALVKAILNDGSIVARPEPEETRIFASADRAVQRRDGYAYAVALFSPRISAFEYGNGENLRGWWTGIGMTQLYNADLGQYGGSYWATVDPLRLAGTTTDRSGSGTPGGFKKYPNARNLVGGAELNRQFATLAMDFAMSGVTGTTLSGKKAWFLFGDRIVALGTGISSSDNVEIETIVENRRLTGAGENVLTVNDASKPVTAGWRESMAATRWAHLAGNTASGSDTGYVFPASPVVNGLRESRSGSWSQINTGGPATVQTERYLTLALSHGSNPSAASYSYIVLPNRSVAATAAFASANPVTVVENSLAASAVQDSEQGLTGVVFWADASKTVTIAGQSYLSSDKKAVVTLQQQGTDVQLAVADPTQSNTGQIRLELYRSATTLQACDPAITVLQRSPTIKLAVNVNGSAGKSFACHFSIKKPALTPLR
ncbi:polysaccharide lyase 8 family protein [Duganella qianjiadongensis]|uniref:Hyaluronate lyase n=1 Tax=Duganella qianjiadongensis TaxID=2692176 RepID=A0ABW9VM91_9BURK|nr:hyaluronate lyase [Duganella qianjiadongensis]